MNKKLRANIGEVWDLWNGGTHGTPDLFENGKRIFLNFCIWKHTFVRHAYSKIKIRGTASLEGSKAVF